MRKKSKILFFRQKTLFGPPKTQFIAACLVCDPHDSGPKNLPGKCSETSAELGFEICISIFISNSQEELLTADSFKNEFEEDTKDEIKDDLEIITGASKKSE